MSGRAWVPWLDTTLRAKVTELLAVLPAADVELVRRWMDDPRFLTAFELQEVEERILPYLRDASGQYGVQPRYRWVDNETGEVDGPVY